MAEAVLAENHAVGTTGETGGRATVDSDTETTRRVEAQVAMVRAEAEEKAFKVQEAACAKGKAVAEVRKAEVIQVDST